MWSLKKQKNKNKGALLSCSNATQPFLHAVNIDLVTDDVALKYEEADGAHTDGAWKSPQILKFIPTHDAQDNEVTHLSSSCASAVRYYGNRDAVYLYCTENFLSC